MNEENSQGMTILSQDVIKFELTNFNQPSLLLNGWGDLILTNPQRQTGGRAFVVGGQQLQLNYGKDFQKGIVLHGDVQVTGSLSPAKLKFGNIDAQPNAELAGCIRYREEANASYVEMCMKDGPNKYEWSQLHKNQW